MSFFGSNAVSARGSASLGGIGDRSKTLARRYQPFANPFFDHASTYTPPSVQTLFKFCRHYHLTHGVIHSVATKAAQYPVTDIVLQHEHRSIVRKWEELLIGQIDYRTRQFEINLDYNVLGNAFVSVNFPFRKKLICSSCNAEHDAVQTRPYWRYTNHRWWLTCPKCGQSNFAKSRDDYYQKLSDIGLIRWNPENVSVFYNETTGRVDYALKMSPGFRNQVTMGRKDLVSTTPEIFLEAAKKGRALVFDRSEVFHMKRPGISGLSNGWGVPMLMPVLKDAFLTTVMRKAMESILLQHVVPQVFLFPQPATSGADPFSVADLSQWRDHIRRELGRQRMDPAYYGILPFPVGHQVIGGDGRSLLLMPEIQQLTEQIVVGMGFPAGLVFGQGTYAGSSVSMRMLENYFLSNIHSQKRLLGWVIKRIGSYMNWPIPSARFKPFKMADDLQRQAFMFQLNQAGKISDTTLLSYADLQTEDESKLQVAESSVRQEAVTKQNLLQAEIEGQAMVIGAKYQAKAQAAMAEAQAQQQADTNPDPFAQSQSSSLTEPPGITLDAAASALASKLRTMEPDRQQVYLSQLQSASPEMAQLVQEQMAGGGEGGAPAEGAPPPQGQQGEGGVDMRPMPEQLPPRRQTLA